MYLVSKDNKHFMVDSAVKSNWGKLKRRLNKILRGDTLSALVLTHAHFDHAQNAFRIKTQYNTKIIINKNEEELLEKGINPQIMGTNVFGKFVAGLSKTRTGDLLDYSPVECDNTFEDKYDMTELGFNAYIMHTPGHTQGSSSIIVDDEIALVGDSMFGIVKNSIFPPFAQDAGMLVESWGKLIDTGCCLFMPGHGAAVSRGLLQKEHVKYKQKYWIK